MIYYLPLEPYQERYTLQLKDWTLRAFERNKVDPSYVMTIEPFGFGDNAIIENTGPLDYWRRTRWALLQVEQLITWLKRSDAEDAMDNTDVIYFQDMFHPGIEALFYILAQKPVEKRPKIYVQNCAQSMDIYDFTFPMLDWMRPYELMCDNFVSGVFVASTIHKELMQISGFKAPIHVTGLPFDREEVVQRLGKIGESIKPWSHKKNRVVFTSRFDTEKQPHFFLDIVEDAVHYPRFHGLEFMILQGGIFNSTDPTAIERARKLESQGKLVIKEKLSKDEYYSILNDSKVQINTALQDFVSNTLNEASALSVKSLLPCFRGFPEAVNSNPKYLYTPFNLSDAIEKLGILLLSPYNHKEVHYAAEVQHKSLDTVIKIMVDNSGTI